MQKEYKSGSTIFLEVHQVTDVERVGEIIFTLTGAETVQKNYPEEVIYADEVFFIPLTQENTGALAGPDGHPVKIEGQINYKDKSVGKTTTGVLYFSSTLATAIVEGNTPSPYQLQDVKLEVLGGVVIASVSLEEIEQAKNEIREAAAEAVAQAGQELDRKYEAALGGCSFSVENGRVAVEVEV